LWIEPLHDRSILERLSVTTSFSITTHPALAASHLHHRSRNTDFGISKMDVLRAIYSSSCLRCTSKDGLIPHNHARFSRTQNDRAPAARLSPELLSSIFFWCLPTDTFYIYDYMLPTQVVATHVCHRWREIGLQSAVLWSRINLDNMSMARTFLERSGQVQLTVCIAMRDEPGNDDVQCASPPDACAVSDAFDILHRHSLRISTLTIRGSEVDWDDLEEKMITCGTRFPNLRNLDASVASRDDDFDTDMMTLRALVRRETTPIQLTKLKVAACRLDLLAVDFSCMTSLHLTCWAPLAVGQAQWRELLVSAQRLAVLYIGNIRAVPTLEHGALIRFMHITNVYLHGPLQMCARFLNHICVSKDARIVVEEIWASAELRDNLDTNEAQHMFTRFLLRHLAKISYDTCFEIRYLPGARDGAHSVVLLTTGRGYFVITPMDTSLQVNLTWMLDQFPADALRRVEACSITGRKSTNTWFTSSDDWTQLCERMPSIRRIHVDSTTVETCLQHATFPVIQELNVWYDEGPSDSGPGKDQLFRFWARQAQRNRFACIQLDAALDVRWSHVHDSDHTWPIQVKFKPHHERQNCQFVLTDLLPWQ
jgi:hypothetical protein